MNERDLDDLRGAVEHCRAGLKALEAAESTMVRTGSVYPTHIHLATAELAHTIEVATKVALRSQ